MKNLIIIGAGGFGREIYHLAISTAEYNSEYVIKGYIDDNILALDRFDNYPKIISTIKDYTIEPDDVFICAIGNMDQKSNIVKKMVTQGAEFINLIHPSARIYSNTELGKGIIICDNSTISCDCKISDFVSIHPSVCVGHDVTIGKYSSLYSFAFIAGNVTINDSVNVFPRASILPNITIGERSSIGSCSLVIKNVQAGVSVFGIPAKTIF